MNKIKPASKTKNRTVRANAGTTVGAKKRKRIKKVKKVN